VRFRNQGVEPFSSRSVPPVNVGFRWFDADERLVEIEEHRTRFPVLMTPGRAVTLPVQLETPTREGAYTLVVCPVIEGQCWVAESGIAVPVAIRQGPALPGVLDLRPEAVQQSYAEEHLASRRMLGERASRLLGTPGRRILEIGGGASPQIAWYGAHDAVNVDINLPLLELGSLWYEHRAGELSDRVAFLCADATDLPFESETFDIVAMFATLHHFAEPEALMRECRRVIQPDGLVAVLCEPIGGSLESTEILRDLSKGINEQIFTASEYIAIFASAGLEPIAGNQVGGSFGAFLKRAEPSGVTFTRVLPVSPTLAVGSPVAVDEARPEHQLAEAPASWSEAVHGRERRGLGLARRVQQRVKRALSGRR
jgi:ubiquinone/menaquinone biosynthesis C-methylase UbiE